MNVDTAKHFRCPQCGSIAPFVVGGEQKLASSYIPGVKPEDPKEWDDGLICSCSKCGKQGYVSDFRYIEPEKGQPVVVG